ncbi:MAG: response regulator [Candidatus Omnitrophota bacterium]
MKKLLNYQPEIISRRDTDDPWKLVYSNFHPAKEALREALCTLGNGYFGTRGAACESTASRVHYPATYIAGVYNQLSTQIAGKTVANEDLINCPNWLFLSFKTDKGRWIQPYESKILSFYQELNIYNGSLSRRVRFEDKNGYRFTIETKRIVSMKDHHLAAIRYTITAENYSGLITIRSGLDGNVENNGVKRYKELNSKHLTSLSLGKVDKQTIQLTVKTDHSRIIISQAAKTRIFCGKEEIAPKSQIFFKGKKALYQDLIIKAKQAEEYRIEKIVAIYTSNDKSIEDPTASAIKTLRDIDRFDSVFREHRQTWRQLWKRFDIRIKGDVAFHKIIRIHIFHLLQTASPHNVDIDAGLPARGLHGEAYRGHIFWDELFVMPFYNLHFPEISKALLLYRYRRLEQAMVNAQKARFKGAMYPWQSGAKGDEQTQTIHLNPMSGKWGPDYSHNQRHISFAVAYNVWRYWRSSGDLDFLIRYGAEMMLSISLFAVSLLKFDAKDKRYHTEGLMGPDEFHEKLPGAKHGGFRDNAYTNLLITATLLNTIEILEVLPVDEKNRLLNKLNLNEKVLKHWSDITEKVNIVFNKDGIIGQFEGYFQLKELNWDLYRKKYGNIQRLDRILKAEGKDPNAYKVTKQADVLMIFYLFSLPKIKEIFNRLGYRFDRETLNKNYEYYIKRTSHGSTLSKVVHCYIAQLLGRQAEAWGLFIEVLKSDIYDLQGGTTPEGIHVGVMGGSIQLALKSFVGLEFLEDRIMINPYLPKAWHKVNFRFLYLKHWISLSVNRKKISIFIRGSKTKRFSVPIDIYGKQYDFLCGRIHNVPLERCALGAVWAGVPEIAQERILIVDGNIKNAFMLKSRLEELGYLADCAYSADEALAVLKSGWVDLIISGVVLQGKISADQLLKEIKADKHFSRIPFIVQSKTAGMRDVFYDLGAKHFFARPYDVDKLLKEVKNILENKY